MKQGNIDAIHEALDRFKIELPSWGFADTGTRFGKFFQEAAASSAEEKFHDAGLVHQLTGTCPTIAVHALWDFDFGAGEKEYRRVAKLARGAGLKIGSINPNVFQEQPYKFGSFCSPDKKTQKQAMQHTLECVEIAKATRSKVISFWLADGTNYPGQDSMRRRKQALEKAYRQIHEKLPAGTTMLVEYKPFEPAFYHTDIGDWGMAYALCKRAGKKAKVLVDTGHHYPGVNIEQIVAYLLDENMLGGFHFNDRKYADDDLTLGSIDPYAVFRIFNEIVAYTFDTGKDPKLAYMVDQSHNLKPKIEAMVQTVDQAQRLYTKALLVDRKALAKAQKKMDVVLAESILKDAYETDVRKILGDWRKDRDLPVDPLKALRDSGVIDKLAKERQAARIARGEVQSASFA